VEGRERKGRRGGGQGGEWGKELWRTTFECLPPRLKRTHYIRSGSSVNSNREAACFIAKLGGTKFMQEFAKSWVRTKREVFVYSYYTIMASAHYLLHGSWRRRNGRPCIQ
jgi:hypothetical protein